jgi:hypothetical protein
MVYLVVVSALENEAGEDLLGQRSCSFRHQVITGGKLHLSEGGEGGAEATAGLISCKGSRKGRNKGMKEENNGKSNTIRIFL